MGKNGFKINLIDRRGDRGMTSLYSGERVSKSSLRPEVLGDLDELQGVLGVARCHSHRPRTKKEIFQLQQDLFVVGSEIATIEKAKGRLPQLLDENRLKQFEQKVQALHDDVTIPQSFVIPGKNLAAAYLHQARAVARRCERKAVRLYETKQIKNPHLLAWLNRLSVYLFLMAQYEDHKPTVKK